MEDEIIKTGRPEQIIDPSDAIEETEKILKEMQERGKLTTEERAGYQSRLGELTRFLPDEQLNDLQPRLEEALKK